MRRLSPTQWFLFVGLCAFILIGCGHKGTSTNQATSSASTAQNTPNAASTASAANAANPQNPAAAPSSAVAAPNPTPEPPPPVEIPAGTSIVVTADESINSGTANPGDHFAASLAAPVRVNGQEVIPAGTKVSGRVDEAKSAGKLKGNGELRVSLSSVRLNGQEYQLQTSSYMEEGKSRGKRTAIGAGGGAAVGAILGGLLGKGKGAAIGALAGGGAGTAGAAYTGNTEVSIPAETTLRFKLTQPLQIPGQ